MKRLWVVKTGALIVVLGAITLAVLDFEGQAASFARVPTRRPRTDIGVRPQDVQEPGIFFTPYHIAQLRRVFFNPMDRSKLPSATRTALYWQRRRLLGQHIELSRGQFLPPNRVAETVFIPRSVFPFLGLNVERVIRVGILDKNIFLYDDRTGRIHDVLPNFLWR